MTMQPIESVDTNTEIGATPPPAQSPRDAITKSITDATMPVAAKKLAAKLLTKNKAPGTHFVVTMLDLRAMCHAATNLDVIKHLRRLRAANLVEYTINFGTQKVEMRFIVS